MGEPFVLCYGKFAGKAIEAMMFDSKGYEYLDHQAVRNGDENQFVLRVRRLVARGETPRIVARCQCGASATHVYARRGSDGVGFGEFCCATCALRPMSGYEAIELKFSSILRFHGKIDQGCFIRELKQACGFGGSEKITAEKAHAFFYPPVVKPVPTSIRSKELELPF